MATFTFIPADPATHRDALLDLNIEYLNWVLPEFGKLTGMSPQETLGMEIPAYVHSVIDKVCGDPPPSGAFYLVESGGVLAGMGGLRRVRDGVAEVKRIYVRPAHRGQRLGQAILQRVMDDAKAFGYRHMWLDTAPFMQAAHRIYEQFGFVDRGPYAEVEAPEAFYPILRFMEKSI